MKRSSAKSRLIRRNRERRKKRIIKGIKRIILFVCTVSIIVFSIIAIKSGMKTGQNIKYPVEYSDYILEYSAENRLDPYIVISVIKQESNFISDAKSPYAGGLMQLTEITAKEYGEKLGLESFNYMDPETNIRIGCYLLRSLIDRYDGVLETALAAYNAGSSNVDSWLADSNYSHDGRNLYYIPYTETRYYVKKVMENIEDYKNLGELEKERKD